MSLSTAQHVKQTFNLIALRRESDVLLTGRQWEKRNALVERCDKARKRETALFNERFDARIATQLKELINRAGSKTKEHKPVWASDDVFDKTANLAQADTSVRSSHQQRITRIDQFEERELESLMQSAARENALQGKAARSFNRTVDRRLGGERRVRPNRSRER